MGWTATFAWAQGGENPKDTATTPASRSAAAKSSSDAAAKPPAAPPIFFLRDGSKVAGFPKFATLQVETKYGTLRVPQKELVRVRLTPRVGAELQARIRALIQALASDDFDVREDATLALGEVGLPALPQLQRAKESADDETKNRAEILVSDLETKRDQGDQQHGDEISSPTGDRDEVVTRRFTIRGLVKESVFKIGTRYGALELAVGDIVGIDFGFGGKVERTVNVAGSKTVPKNWVKTKVTVRDRQKLSIRASGSLNVSNYNVTAGPGGTTRYSDNTFKNFPQLALIGKVGKKGKEFLIGANYKGKAKGGGALYVGVVPFRRNYKATGNFKVKIVAGE